MGRFCLWETSVNLLQFRFAKAARRWAGLHDSGALGIRVFYPSIRSMRKAMAPDFVLQEVVGIGIAVPPSSIRWIPGRTLAWLGTIDRLLERIPFVRGLSDHRLLIFARQ
jgi:hypothetical protein